MFAFVKIVNFHCFCYSFYVSDLKKCYELWFASIYKLYTVLIYSILQVVFIISICLLHVVDGDVFEIHHIHNCLS